jgi:hypothetical protein
MGCNCGKKKVNGQTRVFSTEEQARMARERAVRVLTSAGSSQAKKTDWNTKNTQSGAKSNT